MAPAAPRCAGSSASPILPFAFPACAGLPASSPVLPPTVVPQPVADAPCESGRLVLTLTSPSTRSSSVQPNRSQIMSSLSISG